MEILYCCRSCSFYNTVLEVCTAVDPVAFTVWEVCTAVDPDAFTVWEVCTIEDPVAFTVWKGRDWML